jgi:hypothetical protein
MNALEGVWARAAEEYKMHVESGPGSEEPEHVFCLAYVYGVAFGLALSTVRPDLAKTFEPQFRKRGWLKEHEKFRPPGKWKK